MKTKKVKSLNLRGVLSVLSVFVIVILLLYCSNNKSEKSFFNRLQPVPLNSGFKMDGYWVWGGSVIKVNDTYHLFVSRWPKGNNFPLHYRLDSEIVRATSSTILGPYQFQEVVIGERDSSYWDSNMAHNPTIHKIGNEYVLFYIGSNFTKLQPDGKYLYRCVGYASAESITGPWKRCDKPIINQESNNPAVYVEKNGNIKLMTRDAELRILLATAPSYKGPYKVENSNIWPACRLEDFYLFKHNNQYHCICEDNVGEVSGHDRWGVDIFSNDGIQNWKKYDPLITYDHDITYDDGSILHCVRRERPQLFIENGKVVCLLTGVYDGNNSWCQPVELHPHY